MKVVHHDQLKPYRSCKLMDNTWAMEQAQGWAPLEVSPPALDTDSADPDLELSGLFSNADSGNTPPDPAGHTPETAPPPKPSSPGLSFPSFRIVGVERWVVVLEDQAADVGPRPGMVSGWLIKDN